MTIGGVTRTVALNFTQGVDLSNPMPLAHIAPVLQAAIRSALAGDPAPNSVVANSSQNPDNWQAGVYARRRGNQAQPIHESQPRTSH